VIESEVLKEKENERKSIADGENMAEDGESCADTTTF